MTTPHGNQPDVDLDRRLARWLDESAAHHAPTSLETAFIEGVAASRQRPALATTERWISMETRAQLGVVPRIVVVLMTMALLAALAVGSFAVAAAITDTNLPAPFGVARNGLIA